MRKTSPLKILITDDNEELRENLRNHFKYIKNTMVVGEAESGEEAVEFVKKHAVDIVTMDIYMGGMNGLEAIKQIHAIRPELPVIVYTSDEMIGMESYESGALYYITKPATIADLESIIEYTQIKSHSVF